jgi:hypothetical protein
MLWLVAQIGGADGITVQPGHCAWQPPWQGLNTVFRQTCIISEFLGYCVSQERVNALPSVRECSGISLHPCTVLHASSYKFRASEDGRR